MDRLAAGEAFADLLSWRKVVVSGPEANTWLNSLISADISDLAPGQARRSLLLSPTGRVRAEFTVAVLSEGLLLLQDPVQLQSVSDLLSPYILSSDVQLSDRSAELALFAFPGRPEPPVVEGTQISSPSCLGRGSDLLAPAEAHQRLIDSLADVCSLVEAEVVEQWRIEVGIPRVGIDATGDDLPQEGGLTDEVSFGKGCYLGQEAVAKVSNLGHPRRILLHLRASGPVSSGDSLNVYGRAAGRVTSAAHKGSGSVVLAKITWPERGGPFRTALGVSVTAFSRRGGWP